MWRWEGGQVACGGGASHTLPTGASLFAEKPFWSLRGVPLVGMGRRIKRIDSWVLGSQLGISQFSHFILPGSCQVFVNSPILQLRKWRPRKMKLLGQGNRAEMRLSLALHADQCLSTVFHRLPTPGSVSPHASQPSCPKPHSFLLRNPPGLPSSPRSPPSPNCSI